MFRILHKPVAPLLLACQHCRYVLNSNRGWGVSMPHHLLIWWGRSMPHIYDCIPREGKVAARNKTGRAMLQATRHPTMEESCMKEELHSGKLGAALWRKVASMT
eukprot:14322398-Ditylum_brightwellii.AAC.1